ncbi:MAG TPA: hypothetical protein VIO57_04195 [Chloroflexota bacterium]|jgi:hypothetical protein
MNNRNFQHLIALVRQCDPASILKAASRCDGHTIFKPQAFLDAGLPNEIVEHVTRKHGSDGSPKGTIFVDGQPVTALTGVYGLDLLRFLATALNVEYRSAIGRGFEAQNIQSALHAHFKDRISESAR